MYRQDWLKQQQGYLMLVAVLLVMVIGFLGVAVALFVAGGSNSTIDFQFAEAAYDLAVSGLEHASHKLLNTTIANRSTCASGLNLSNTLTTGAYTATSAGPYFVSSPTTLNGALTASATTIPVVSTANYQSSGRMMIDQEMMSYGSVDTTDFLNVKRGADGTTAATHASGAAIGQYQCTVTGLGGVPSLTAPAHPGDPYGKRTLQKYVTLQDGWLVGQHTAGHVMDMAHWNYPTESQWSNSSTTLTFDVDLSSIYMLSNVDGWAVGSAASSNMTIFHWNGSTWSQVLPSVALNVSLNGVFCNASNDCWVVGQNNSNYPTIEHWDGSSWSRVLLSAQLNVTLQSVYCNNTNDCWAVGQNNSNYPTIVHWDGTSWTHVLPTAQVNVTLYGVSCNSTSDCWAVGQNNSNYPTIEHWNGTNWSRVLPTAQVNQTLNDVYCNSSSDCWAVGVHLAGAILFIEHWNGTNWSSVSVSSGANIDLNAIGCFNSNDCWAIGQNSYLVHWDGSTWTQYSVAGTFPSVQLYGISLLESKKSSPTWKEIFA